MKIYISIFLLLTAMQMSAQITFPYLQEFDDHDFYVSEEFNMGGIASIQHPFGGNSTNIDLVIQEAEGYSWSNSINHVVTPGTKGLKAYRTSWRSSPISYMPQIESRGYLGVAQ